METKVSKGKSSKAARAWAAKAWAHRPATFKFSRVPVACQRTGCGGYHETLALLIDSEGKVWWEQTRGYHASVFGTQRVYRGQGLDALARAAYELMRWARRVDPWARYPEWGEREPARPDLEPGEFWL